MIGTGTLANVAAILVGGAIGLLLKGGLKERFQRTIMQALGLATIFVGISGALQGLLVMEDGKLKTTGTMIMIISLVVGGFFGEAINVEEKLEGMGKHLKGLVNVKGDNRFVEGFVTTSLVVCVGAMAVVGSLEDGLTGDASMLYIKALLDGVIVLIFASTLGSGALFAALPLGIYQGGITLLAKLIAPFFSVGLIGSLSMIGSILIFGVGVNLAFDKKLKVGNMLPALLVPIIYEVILKFM